MIEKADLPDKNQFTIWSEIKTFQAVRLFRGMLLFLVIGF